MTKIKGLAAIIGLTTLSAIVVACSNGETSSSPEEGQPTGVSSNDNTGTSAATSAAVQPLVAPLDAPVAVDAPPGAAYSSLLQTGISRVGIWVTGEGRITLEPDLVLLNIGVETNAKAVAEAREQAARAMDAIMATLGQQGVEQKDIQTKFFDISPQYEFQDVVQLGRRTSKRVLVGYRVSNSTSVKVRDLNAVGSIIDEVATAGGDAIRINGIRFSVEDPKPLMVQMREEAVGDALAKAQQFASLTGVSVGRLVFISESGGGIPVVKDFARVQVEVAGFAAAPSTPISGGELELRMTVQAVFDIQ